MEFRSLVAGSLAEQAERLVDADTEGAGDDALRLLNDDPRLERRLKLGYALKEKRVRVVQSLLRRTQERVLALIEVQEQRIDLLVVKPRANRVEQPEQERGQLSELDFDLPRAVVLDEFGLVVREQKVERLGVRTGGVLDAKSRALHDLPLSVGIQTSPNEEERGGSRTGLGHNGVRVGAPLAR